MILNGKSSWQNIAPKGSSNFAFDIPFKAFWRLELGNRVITAEKLLFSLLSGFRRHNTF